MKEAVSKMIDQMYYDTFEDSYVLEQDLGAPPERYILLFRGTNGMYVESWMVNDDKNLCMSIAFNEDEYYDNDWYYTTLQEMCKKHNCKLSRRRYIAIPANEFDERVNKYIKN